MADALGTNRAGAVDVTNACDGIDGVGVADSFLRTGKARRVLVAIDARRADAAGTIVSHRRPAAGTMFDTHVAPPPWTPPAMASVFSGLPPAEHGEERLFDLPTAPGEHRNVVAGRRAAAKTTRRRPPPFPVAAGGEAHP